MFLHKYNKCCDLINIIHELCYFFYKANSESLFETDLQRRLYPGHTYSHVFGGHPLHIVDLKV